MLVVWTSRRWCSLGGQVRGNLSGAETRRQVMRANTTADAGHDGLRRSPVRAGVVTTPIHLSYGSYTV